MMKTKINKLVNYFIKKIKSLIEWYSIFLLIIFFLNHNNGASYYNKQIININTENRPFDYIIDKVDTDYSIHEPNPDFPLPIIYPEAPFSLDNSIYINQIIGYYLFKNFMGVLVRTKENQLKVIKLWRDDSGWRYKLYDPADFYSDKSIFQNKWDYSKPFISINMGSLNHDWNFFGWSIFFVLVFLIGNKLYVFIKKRNKKTNFV